MDLTFMRKEFELRRDQAQQLAEAIVTTQNLLDNVPAYAGYGQVSEEKTKQLELLETLQKQAVSFLGRDDHPGIRMTKSSDLTTELFASVEAYTSLITQLTFPAYYLVQIEGGSLDVCIDPDEVRELVNDRLAHKVKAGQDDKPDFVVFPVLGKPMDVEVSIDPGELSADTGGAEPDEYILYRNDREIDSFDNEEDALDFIRNDVTEQGYKVTDYQIEKVEKTSYFIEEGDAQINIRFC